ncbi:hypothetical protein SS50377_25722 [Spironucleus salmonicida]|uniref:Uncharacterized protein n=1 Tax=Spironucleus salmonicida TaxID=348837 RepID=V6LEJ1_9EUKA|nr:hypothetical protein SS50377_25722 [Spironucleus salmonicida]|eukprot:EST42668.1 hypothetical protein SS50377_17683 [Spironucleus salmonicida]
MNFKAEILQYKYYLYNLFSNLQNITPQPHASHIHDGISLKIISELRQINELYLLIDNTNYRPKVTQKFIQRFQNCLNFDIQKPQFLDVSQFANSEEELQNFIQQANFNQLILLYNKYNKFRIIENPLDFETEFKFSTAESLRYQLQTTFKNFFKLTFEPQISDKTSLSQFAKTPTAQIFHLLTSKISTKRTGLKTFLDRNTGQVIKSHEYKLGQFQKSQNCEFCRKKIYGIVAIETHFYDKYHVANLQKMGLNWEEMRGIWNIK